MWRSVAKKDGRSAVGVGPARKRVIYASGGCRRVCRGNAGARISNADTSAAHSAFLYDRVHPRAGLFRSCNALESPDALCGTSSSP